MLAGDFRSDQAKRLVQKYFGSLKAGQPVPPVVVAQPRITAERRVVVADRIELPRLSLAWHTPAQYQPGDAEMDVVANLLGGGKSSRLYKKLVYERQVAQSVTAAQDSMSLGSVFGIEVVARSARSSKTSSVWWMRSWTCCCARGPPQPNWRARAVFETQLWPGWRR
ncbi:MAG: insulinase family protein [Rhodoferax sp.]|nr:insulinase family protein [Rhodoferax sp.]